MSLLNIFFSILFQIGRMNRRHVENDIVAMAWHTIQRHNGQQKMHRSTAAAARGMCIDGWSRGEK